MKILFERGANIDTDDEEGMTAIERANIAGRIDVVELLGMPAQKR